MKTINVRQLLRDFKSIFPIPEEGIRVKGRGEIDFVIHRGDGFYEDSNVRQTEEMSDKGGENVRQNEGLSDNMSDKEKYERYWLRTSMGWCQGHFEKAVNHKRYLTTWEDENGILQVDHKWYCQACLDRLLNKGVGKLYDETKNE